MKSNRSRPAALVAAVLIGLVGYSAGAQARYVESDPIGLAGGPNPYSYANQNPTQLVDPNGLAPGDVYAATPASAMQGGINAFVQQHVFGATGTQYSHVVLEINSDPNTGTRYVLQSNPGTGVQITTMEAFAEQEYGRGSQIDRFTPVTALTPQQLADLSTNAEALEGTPYNNQIARDKASPGSLSCAETVQTAYQNTGVPGITSWSPTSPTLPMNISQSPYFVKAPVEPFVSSAPSNP